MSSGTGPLVLLAGFGGLRLGELHALRRSDVELRTGDRIVTAPKTDAGRRAVHLQAIVTRALETHLLQFTAARPDALVFTGPLSEALRRATLYKAWDEARRAVGWPTLRLHDLRHAAGTLAAQTGATQRELIGSPRARHPFGRSGTSTLPSAGTQTWPQGWTAWSTLRDAVHRGQDSPR